MLASSLDPDGPARAPARASEHQFREPEIQCSHGTRYVPAMGHARPMKSDQPVTLKDVAALAGVHPATASRALNDETRLLVRRETAERVLAAADSLGYRPNTVARSLRTRRSHTVGVLIPDLT